MGIVLPGRVYVQDERYAASAWMRTTAGMQEVEQRRSSCRGAARLSFAQLILDIPVQLRMLCKTDAIAPHIHVLYREIPFILNITPAQYQTTCTYQKQLTHAFAQSRGCAVPYVGTLSDMDVAPEPTGRTCGVSRRKVLHSLGFPTDQELPIANPEVSRCIPLIPTRTTSQSPNTLGTNFDSFSHGNQCVIFTEVGINPKLR